MKKYYYISKPALESQQLVIVLRETETQINTGDANQIFGINQWAYYYGDSLPPYLKMDGEFTAIQADNIADMQRHMYAGTEIIPGIMTNANTDLGAYRKRDDMDFDSTVHLNYTKNALDFPNGSWLQTYDKDGNPVRLMMYDKVENHIHMTPDGTEAIFGDLLTSLKDIHARGMVTSDNAIRLKGKEELIDLEDIFRRLKQSEIHIRKLLNTDGVPIGSIIRFPNKESIPLDYLYCDGTKYDTELFKELFKILKNDRLPDLLHVQDYKGPNENPIIWAIKGMNRNKEDSELEKRLAEQEAERQKERLKRQKEFEEKLEWLRKAEEEKQRKEREELLRKQEEERKKREEEERKRKEKEEEERKRREQEEEERRKREEEERKKREENEARIRELEKRLLEAEQDAKKKEELRKKQEAEQKQREEEERKRREQEEEERRKREEEERKRKEKEEEDRRKRDQEEKDRLKRQLEELEEKQRKEREERKKREEEERKRREKEEKEREAAEKAKQEQDLANGKLSKELQIFLSKIRNKYDKIGGPIDSHVQINGDLEVKGTFFNTGFYWSESCNDISEWMPTIHHIIPGKIVSALDRQIEAYDCATALTTNHIIGITVEEEDTAMICGTRHRETDTLIGLKGRLYVFTDSDVKKGDKLYLSKQIAGYATNQVDDTNRHLYIGIAVTNRDHTGRVRCLVKY